MPEVIEGLANDELPFGLEIGIGVPPNDAHIVFVSVDEHANFGALNKHVLEQLETEASLDQKTLSEVGHYFQKVRPELVIIWVVTVARGENSKELLRTNLSAALMTLLQTAESQGFGSKVWIPLMGTGVGKLEFFESAKQTLVAIQSTLGAFRYPRFDILISLPREATQNMLGNVQNLANDILETKFHKYQPNETRPTGDDHRGFGLILQRRTSQGLALNRDRFALAIARLFRIAKGEFSLALLGKWGIGKTSIAEQVSRYLCNEKEYRDDFKTCFKTEPDETDEIEYAVVNFNAWRYRRRPELWIWLYESFVSTFLDCNPAARILRTIRAGIEKHGYWSALRTIVTLALTAVPLMWLSLILPYGAALFGIIGLVALFFLVRRWQGSLRSLVDRYGIVTSHREHLGMQALVGEDLKALVQSLDPISSICALAKARLSGGGSDHSISVGFRPLARLG